MKYRSEIAEGNVMQKQLFILIAASVILGGCSKSAPAATKADDQVAVQSSKPLSEADSDKYIQGMIDSDTKADSGGEAN
ncbi:MAG: hypothetical protein RL367_2643 [Pseudomonadota bacterium]